MGRTNKKKITELMAEDKDLVRDLVDLGVAYANGQHGQQRGKQGSQDSHRSGPPSSSVGRSRPLL